MGSNERHFRVFISSTYLDNAERRRVVEDAILAADMQPVGMERFTASAHPTVAQCKKLARSCDIYVGIVAHRYGWIPERSELSITELEYDAARAAGRACLMFEIDPERPVYPEKDFDAGPERWDKQNKLEDFRAKYAADQMPAHFTDTTLGTKVLHALNDWRREHAGAPEGAAQVPPVAPQDRQEIARYRQALDARHANLELAGFKTRLRVPIDLEELYVPLHAMVDLRAVGEAAFADAAEAEQRLRQGWCRPRDSAHRGLPHGEAT